jgi:glycosyltransferase involved in cell wall biosynthesis
MDGMEWKRGKWKRPVQYLLKRAERIAVRYSDAIVSDNPVLGEYFRDAYKAIPENIAYGAEMPANFDETVLEEFGLLPGSYFLLVARLEPENNIETIIEGCLSSGKDHPLVIVGNHSAGYGKRVYRKFGGSTDLKFTGGIYDREKLASLRHFARVSFHGHSVGGTNPSLLEAMAAGSPIIAHENPYNRWVLGENAKYFRTAEDIVSLSSALEKTDWDEMVRNNLKRIREEFQWERIVRQYLDLFERLLSERKSGAGWVKGKT